MVEFLPELYPSFTSLLGLILRIKSGDAHRKSLLAIEKKLEQLEISISQKTIANVEIAFEHLVTGANSTIRDVKIDEFRFARQKFCELEKLDENGITYLDGNKIIPNQYLIACGYLGSHYYFALRGDFKQSLAHVYKCTKRFPFLALEIFDESLFAKETRENLLSKEDRFHDLASELGRIQAENGKQEFTHLAQSAGKILLVGGSAVGAVATVFFAPQIGMRLGITAARLSQTLKIEKPAIQNTSILSSNINKIRKEKDVLLNQLVNDCEKRLREIDSVSQEDLQNFIKEQMSAFRQRKRKS